MKGLLYKDAVTLLKQMKFFLGMIVIFAALPGLSTVSLAMIYAAMLPFSAMAYDEQAKWNRLAAMLPYTDMQLVLSKYILGWASVLGALVIAAAVQTASALIRGARAELGSGMLVLILSASLALLLLAFALPLLYRFGVERGRLAFLLVVIGGAILLSIFGSSAIQDMREEMATGIVAAAAALAVVATPISVLASRRLRSCCGAA